MSADLFGEIPTPPRAPFRDIRNQRANVAEDKATLTLQLRQLATRCPRDAGAWPIPKVRAWDDARKRALKACNSTRASVPVLRGLVNALREFGAE